MCCVLALSEWLIQHLSYLGTMGSAATSHALLAEWATPLKRMGCSIGSWGFVPILCRTVDFHSGEACSSQVSPSPLVVWWKVDLTQEKRVDWLGRLCVSNQSRSSVDNWPEAFHKTSCGRFFQRSLNHTPEERTNTCRKSGQWKCDYGCKQRKQMWSSSSHWPKTPSGVLTLEVKVGKNKGSGRIRIVLLSFCSSSTAGTGSKVY